MATRVGKGTFDLVRTRTGLWRDTRRLVATDRRRHIRVLAFETFDAALWHLERLNAALHGRRGPAVVRFEAANGAKARHPGSRRLAVLAVTTAAAVTAALLTAAGGDRPESSTAAAVTPAAHVARARADVARAHSAAPATRARHARTHHARHHAVAPAVATRHVSEAARTRKHHRHQAVSQRPRATHTPAVRSHHPAPRRHATAHHSPRHPAASHPAPAPHFAPPPPPPPPAPVRHPESHPTSPPPTREPSDSGNHHSGDGGDHHGGGDAPKSPEGGS